jgi:hypothetical protein
VISGTDFTIEPADFVLHVCRGLRHPVASHSEIQEIRAQCAANRALCLACSDAMVVIDLRGTQRDNLEVFVWIAMAFRHGAFERQEAALLAIARDLGAKTLAFVTRRRGWARRLGPEWRRRGIDEFVRSVE